MVRLALSGSKGLINIPKQKQTGVIHCFSLMDITPIIPTGSLNMPACINLGALLSSTHYTHSPGA